MKSTLIDTLKEYIANRDLGLKKLIALEKENYPGLNNPQDMYNFHLGVKATFDEITDKIADLEKKYSRLIEETNDKFFKEQAQHQVT